jgi:RNA polymerase sigma-70 factor, ECF subfamily
LNDIKTFPLNNTAIHRDLVLRLKEGDGNSFKILFELVYPQLCAYANKFVNDRDEAEEITQEVFFKLWENRHTLDEDDSVKGFLFTSVKNRCLHFLEHQKVRHKYAEVLQYVYSNLQQDSAHEILVGNELDRDFVKALEILPAECRRIFELNRMQGLKYSEIASHLKISQKTVETQMSRALHKLKLQLKDYILILFLVQF